MIRDNQQKGNAMSHPAEDTEREIGDLIEERVGEECAAWFVESLYQMREDSQRFELVRLLQKWVAST